MSCRVKGVIAYKTYYGMQEEVLLETEQGDLLSCVLIMGCLGEGSKKGKRIDQSGSKRRKKGKIEGKGYKSGWLGANKWLVSA